MTDREFLSWLRQEHHNLLIDDMVKILDRAEARARQAAGKHSCSCGCGQKCGDSGYERKSAAHTPFYRRIEWEHRHKGVTDSGVFSAYASVWGDPDGEGGDCTNDVVLRGAFRDHAGGSVPLVWQHNSREPIGRARDLYEDAYGLKFIGHLELESARGREAYAFLKNNGLDSFSIGYALPYDDSYEDRRNGGRVLKRIRLHEISLVTIPCNPGARMIQ